MLDIKPHPIGLPPKVWRAHFHALLVTGELNPEIIEFMNSYQQFAVNEVKKAFKHVNGLDYDEQSDDQ